jgi:uncharacterized OB-fold protein
VHDIEGIVELSLPMDASYNWSVGAYMERFFGGFKDKKLLGIKCLACGKVFVPPRMICEDCFAETEEWLELGEEGTVEGYTVGYVKVDEKIGGLTDLDEPEIIALIKPEGADTCLIHRISEAKPSDIKVSMRVQAVWAEEAKGELSDLRYFKPAG